LLQNKRASPSVFAGQRGFLNQNTIMKKQTGNCTMPALKKLPIDFQNIASSCVLGNQLLQINTPARES